MSTTSLHPGLGSSGSGENGVRLIRVPANLRLGAAARLIGEQSGDPLLAGQRFLDSATQLRVDLDLMWCTVDEQGGMGSGGGMVRIRQVVLAVIGSGRTAMLFVSGAERKGKWPGAAKLRAMSGAGVALAEARQERIALVNHACEQVAAPGVDGRSRAVLSQALLESRETDAIEALQGAGFQRLGDLAYLRRALPKAGPGRALDQAESPKWPEGIRVCSVAQLLADGQTKARVDALIVDALERSYTDTQDCPELCGMRGMDDVLDSHRSVGVFDPAHWWLAMDDSGVARACLLLSVCPEQDSVELVYLGLAPEVRGVGLGSMLLGYGLRRLYDGPLAPLPRPDQTCIGGSGGVTCAVDTRNTPAMKLYRKAGFERFGLRVPMVRRLGPVHA